MVRHKRVNKNPFNEKLIHRYLLEVFYGIHGSDRAAINRLLPQRLHHSSINLVVPEAHLPKHGYRPDLTLFFRGQREGIPLEVKWSSEVTPAHQLAYLEKKRGVLVSVETPRGQDRHPRIHFSQVKWEHFQEWFARSSLRLLRDAFDPGAGERAPWVIVLRGADARENFTRMLASRGSPFWAFKNNPTAIKSVLEIAKGDQLLFLFASTSGTGSARTYEGNKLMLDGARRRIVITDWYIGKVTDPYFMALSGLQGTFFEKGSPAVNDRRWPHFLAFARVTKQAKTGPIDFVRGRFAPAFAASANHGGVPVRLAPDEWAELKSSLLALDGTTR